MKYALLYESADGFREKVPQNIEAHRALWREFKAQGTLLMVGPFTDAPAGGALAIFTTRAAAEAFIARDPFVLNGLVAKHTLRELAEVLVP